MEEETVNNNNTTNTNTNVSASVSPLSPPQPQPVSMMNMVNGGGVTTTTPTTASATTTAVSLGAATTMAATTTPLPPGAGGSLDLFGEKKKKKRGRPRKYDSDGNLRLTYQNATPPSLPLPLPSSQTQGFTLSPTSPPFSSEFFSSKRGRGRSSTSHFLASFGESMDGEAFAITAGGDFVPHVVTVHTGEDVAGKILSFAQKSPRGLCVLSANGAISNVTLHQPGSSGGLLTYEGRFEILSLSGSYTVSDNNGMRSRTGGLSVSLAGPDGRVIGGGVAGLLTAASPIQLVLGSFIPNGYRPHKRKYHREHTVASPISSGPDTITAARPISQANPDVENNFLIPTSQLPEQSQREPVGVTSDQKLNLDASPHDAAATWNASEEFSDQRISPDINISLPDE